MAEPRLRTRPATPRLAGIASATLIALVAVATYWDSFEGPFVLDDEPSIVDNLSIRQLTPLWPILTSKHFTTVVGRPLLNLSLAVSYHFGGTNVAGYHWFSLGVHIAVGLVLFGLIQRTLLLPSVPESLRRMRRGFALTCTLIWLVHPLASAAVLYIVQRAELMVSLFYLLTLYCVLRGATAERNRTWWYLAAVLACLAGMATKEVMVTAPLVVLLFDRAFLSDSFSSAFRQRKGLYMGLAATWLLLAVLVSFSDGRIDTAGFGGRTAVADYALTQIRALRIYLQRALWPHRLVFDYGEYLVRDPQAVLPDAILICTLLAASILAWRWNRQVGFLALSFWIVLAPTSSVVPIFTQTAAEHRMYLALTCLVTLAVLAAHSAWSRLQARLPPAIQSRPAIKGLPAIAVAALVVCLAVRTWARTQDYRSLATLWQVTLENWPENDRAHNNLGVLVARSGNPERALPYFTEAIRLREGNVDAWFNRGSAYMQLKREQEALRDYSEAIRIQPKNAQLYAYRAATWAAINDNDRALLDLNRAIELAPADAGAYMQRATIFSRLGRDAEAQRDREQFEKLGGQPNSRPGGR